MRREEDIEHCHRGLQQKHNREQDGLCHKSRKEAGSWEAVKGNWGVSSS